MADGTYDNNHGHSIAGWTAVSALILAAALIAIGVAWGLHAFDIAGVVLAVLGIGAGLILSKAGFGAPAISPPPLPKALEERPATSGGPTQQSTPRHSAAEESAPSAAQTADN